MDLLRLAGMPEYALEEIKSVVEDIDIETLDINHVRRNMGPPNFRGVWYPFLNLTELTQQIYSSTGIVPAEEGI